MIISDILVYLCGMHDAILDKHLPTLTLLAQVANSGITVFDSLRNKHIFASYNFSGLFNYDLDRIREEDSAYFDRHTHPDDLEYLKYTGKLAMQAFYCTEREEKPNLKFIREYRIRLRGKYTRVIEQMQVLELTEEGDVRLSLSILDISPNQGPFERVDCKLLNFKTGELSTLFDDSPEESTNLSYREKTILGLIRDGFLSKEIADRLQISVHTVNTYRQRIIRKTKANNSIEAIRYATRLGLLD